MASNERPTVVRQDSSRRILRDDDSGSKAALQRRRRSATTAILGLFEKDIEPLIPPGNRKAIAIFKGAVRKKINGLAYEGLRAIDTQPGESVSTATTDLAETLAFDDPEDR